MIVIDVWVTVLLLKFDTYIVSLTDPLEALGYTLFLAGFIWAGLFEDIVKFGLARLGTLAVKLALILAYLAKSGKYFSFWKLQPIADQISGQKYFVHPSAKKFCFEYTLNSLIDFGFLSLDRLLKIKALSLKELGIFTLTISVIESVLNIFVTAFIDFFSNLFNLRFSELSVSEEPQRALELSLLLKESLFRSMKFALLLHQLLFLYINFLLIDESIFRLLGPRLGTKVE